MAAPRRFDFSVPADGGTLRLDQLLARCVEGLSRRQARVLIDIGGVFVDGRRVKVASRTLRPGQRIVGTIGGALERATKTPGRTARVDDASARLALLRVVYEDEALVVVEKPSGMPVAATAETDRDDVAALLATRAGASRLHVVHRIDAPTSGLVVLAKTVEASRELSRALAAHAVTREYLAVLAGRMADDRVTVSHPIGGRDARTHLVVEERYGELATRVRCRLETGRTHQIRIHASHVGHPVLGDRVHGHAGPIDPPRLALHAAVLGFAHPVTRTPLRFESPWPDDLAGWLEGLRARDTLGVPLA